MWNFAKNMALILLVLVLLVFATVVVRVFGDSLEVKSGEKVKFDNVKIEVKAEPEKKTPTLERFSCEYMKGATNDMHLFLFTDSHSSRQFIIVENVGATALTSFEVTKTTP